MQLLNIPNVLTAGNFFCGMLSIVLSLVGRVDLAAFPLVASLLFDYLDGMTARLLHQQGELGKQLDSLADVVSFGVAPGMWMFVLSPSIINGDSLTFDTQIIMYQFYDWAYGIMDGSRMEFLPLVALLIPVFSMFRLAKFNIDERQSSSFIGLPTPANTLFFSIYPLMIYVGNGMKHFSVEIAEIFLNPYIFYASVFIFSYLLIAEIPLFSLKFKNLRWKENEIRYIFLILTLILIGVFQWIAMPLVIVVYLILSIVDTKIINRKVI